MEKRWKSLESKLERTRERERKTSAGEGKKKREKKVSLGGCSSFLGLD
jgi:hypothetical protein